MSIKDITVIIATFRSGQKIKSCLNSISREVKVIIVENSNDNDFKNDIENNFSNVECILSGQNLGYGRANNIGLKKVKTKYALILNPDATLNNLTLDNFLKVTNQIPDFAIMGPYLQEEKDKQSEERLKNLKPKSVINLKGFAMFLNIIKFKNIGFFDDSFFFYFAEIDLCKRVIDKGEKINLIPEIKINHDGGKSHDNEINKEMELSRNWHWMWSTFTYHKKYKGFFISLVIIFPKLGSAAFNVLLYFLLLKKDKKEIYYHRLSGLFNAIVGKPSWYRPKV